MEQTTKGQTKQKRNTKATMKREVQKKMHGKKLFRSISSSSLVVRVLLLSVVCMMLNAVNACGSSNTPACDPLPNGNGCPYKQAGCTRVGSLGGVVDDLFQDYCNHDGVGCDSSSSSKPANAMSTAQVIAKYGSIGTWDTSRVTNMYVVFTDKKNINPDIRNWRVDRVVNFAEMFNRADSFNIDLSSWVVSSATNMGYMFTSAYTHTLCGITWIESTAIKTSMFGGGNGKIGTEACSCSPGKFFTLSSKSCTECETGRFQAQPGVAPCATWTTTTCSFGMEPVAPSSASDLVCTDCPIGQYQAETNVPGTSCQNCASGMCSAAGSASCSMCDKLPNGNRESAPTDRVGFLGEIVDDIIGTDSLKKNAAIVKYGLIENWDVSEVTNLQSLFRTTGNAQSDRDRASFNGDISKWQTGKVTNMQERMLIFLYYFSSIHFI